MKHEIIQNTNSELEVLGLHKFTKEQLINIILRKDVLEKKLRRELSILSKENLELKGLIEEYKE